MINLEITKIFNYFYNIDKALFQGQGHFILLHKDPGNDTIAHNAKMRTAYQIIESGYAPKFRLNIFLDLILCFLGCCYFFEYVVYNPPADEHVDDFVYFYLWILGFFEPFDLLHDLVRFSVLLICELDQFYSWVVHGGGDDAHAMNVFGNILVEGNRQMSEVFVLSDYWIREHLNWSFVYGKEGFFWQFFKPFGDFLQSHILFLRVSNLASPILMAYYGFKYFMLAVLFLHFLAKKLLGGKRKNFSPYVEYSEFALFHLQSSLRAKSKNVHNYCKKL